MKTRIRRHRNVVHPTGNRQTHADLFRMLRTLEKDRTNAGGVSSGDAFLPDFLNESGMTRKVTCEFHGWWKSVATVRERMTSHWIFSAAAPPNAELNGQDEILMKSSRIVTKATVKVAHADRTVEKSTFFSTWEGNGHVCYSNTFILLLFSTKGKLVNVDPSLYDHFLFVFVLYSSSYW